MLDTLGGVLDVGGGGEGCVFACLPACHALIFGGFHWFSVAYAPGLRGFIGRQMGLLCLSASSDGVSEGVLLVVVRLS